MKCNLFTFHIMKCQPLLSAKNRKQRLQFTQTHQNWTIEDWKNVAWSDESRFLLRHSDGRVRIWHKEHESMDPSCLVSTVQAGGGVLAHFGPLSTNWASFKRHSLPEYCCWSCPSLYNYSLEVCYPTRTRGSRNTFGFRVGFRVNV